MAALGDWFPAGAWHYKLVCSEKCELLALAANPLLDCALSPPPLFPCALQVFILWYSAKQVSLPLQQCDIKVFMQR